MGSSPNNRDENKKKFLKPPPRYLTAPPFFVKCDICSLSPINTSLPGAHLRNQVSGACGFFPGDGVVPHLGWKIWSLNFWRIIGNKQMTRKKGHKWKGFLVVAAFSMFVELHVCYGWLRPQVFLRLGVERESELSLKFQEVWLYYLLLKPWTYFWNCWWRIWISSNQPKSKCCFNKNAGQHQVATVTKWEEHHPLGKQADLERDERVEPSNNNK